MACTEDFISYTNKNKSAAVNMKETCSNALYRTNSVYKDCSLPFLTSNLKIKKPTRMLYSDSEIDKPEKEITYVRTNYTNKFSHLNIYKIPAMDSHTGDEFCTLKKTQEVVSNPLEMMMDCSIPIIKSMTQSTQAIGTSMTDFRKYRLSKALWSSLSKSLCPCCTGGSDAGDPPSRENINISDDTADFNMISKQDSPKLELDASLISIIQYRNIKKAKLPAKIIKMILHNTHKNAMCILESLKAL